MEGALVMEPLDCPKILCVDFDGVLHSYTSGWQGAWRIPDPPVIGAIDWLSWLIFHGESEFQVCIFSSRNAFPFGRWAMKRWLLKWGLDKEELKHIKFPLFKPAAFLTIDDRAIQFKGKFPLMAELLEFKPWNRKESKNGKQVP